MTGRVAVLHAAQVSTMGTGSRPREQALKMSDKMTEKSATAAFLLVLAALSVYFCYIIARPFLNPVFFAVVIAIAFYPLHTRIHNVIRNPSAAALVSTLCVLLLLVVPAVLVGMAVTGELGQMYQSLSRKGVENGGMGLYVMHLLERTIAWISRYVDLSQFDLRAALLSRVQQMTAFLLETGASVARNITAFFFNAIVTFFTLFFLLREGRSMRKRLAALLPLSKEQFEKLFNGISDAIIANVYGVLAVSLAQGSLAGLAFWSLGLPAPVLWSMVTALFSLVPVIGTAAVWLPASIILFAGGHWGKGLLLLALGAGIIAQADNIVRPYVISQRVRIHTLFIFFSLLGGVQAFGIIGLFIGPIVLSVTMAVFSLLREERYLRSNTHSELNR